MLSPQKAVRGFEPNMNDNQCHREQSEDAANENTKKRPYCRPNDKCSFRLVDYSDTDADVESEDDDETVSFVHQRRPRTLTIEEWLCNVDRKPEKLQLAEDLRRQLAFENSLPPLNNTNVHTLLNELFQKLPEERKQKKFWEARVQNAGECGLNKMVLKGSRVRVQYLASVAVSGQLRQCYVKKSPLFFVNEVMPHITQEQVDAAVSYCHYHNLNPFDEDRIEDPSDEE